METDPAKPMENRAFKSSTQRTQKPVAYFTARIKKKKVKNYTLLIFCTMFDLKGADQDLMPPAKIMTQKSTFPELSANCSKQ